MKANFPSSKAQRWIRAGEMVFPWMFEDFAALAPLQGAAEALAEKADWPQLYDLKALQSTTAPVASATYYDDMYVDCDCAQVSHHIPLFLHACGRPCSGTRLCRCLRVFAATGFACLFSVTELYLSACLLRQCRCLGPTHFEQHMQRSSSIYAHRCVLVCETPGLLP